MAGVGWNEFLRQYYWIVVLIILAALGLLGIVVWVFIRCRRRPRYEYTALEDEAVLQDRLEMDRKLQRDADRNMAMIHCQYYLRGCSRYVFINHLSDIGSRVGKHWFQVRDTTTKTERLLTMAPTIETCPIRCNGITRKALLELFVALQHPYIYPVLDIDFKIITELQFVIVVMPFNDKGTLKDLIYHSHCQDDWREKYHFHGDCLPQSQVQRLGSQILEALLFLKDRGFPPFGHLHSGNVILQNGVARISGLENPLLGFTSRIHSLLPKRYHEYKESIDSVCFGHLLFEMCAGYELTTAHPTEKNFNDLDQYPQVVEVLKFIFDQTPFPKIQEVSALEFFRHIDLRELRSHISPPVFQAKLSPATRSLLKEVRRYQRGKRSSKRKKKRALSSSETIPAELCTSKVQATPPSGCPDSFHTPGSLSHSGSVEYYTPPSTPLPYRESGRNICPDGSTDSRSHRGQLMMEIKQGGRKLRKTVSEERPPEV